MTLQDLGNIGEFVAAVGVIVSLIYLAFQIRQNTRSIRAAAVHQATVGASDFSRSLAESEELAHIFIAGLRGYEQLDTEEKRTRWLSLASIQFRHYEDVFLQYQNGTVGAESWEGWRNSMRPFLASPGFSMFWNLRGDTFAASFRTVVESERAQVQVSEDFLAPLLPSADSRTAAPNKSG
jgi:hypothetical protein